MRRPTGAAPYASSGMGTPLRALIARVRNWDEQGREKECDLPGGVDEAVCPCEGR